MSVSEARDSRQFIQSSDKVLHRKLVRKVNIWELKYYCGSKLSKRQKRKTRIKLSVFAGGKHRLPQNHTLRPQFSGTVMLWSSKVSRLQKLCRLWKCRMDFKEKWGASVRPDIELTEAVIRFNTSEAQKICTWGKKKLDSSYISNNIK